MSPRGEGDPLRMPSLAVLLAANLYPLYGIVALGWEVFPLLLLFWAENVVVGAYNVLRMLWVDPRNPLTWAAKLFLVPFFTFHYGMFAMVHGFFVVALFGGEPVFGEGAVDPSLGWALGVVERLGLGLPLALLVLSHGFSFVWNYVGKGQYRRVDLRALMSLPYGRVVVLHVAILAGGFLTLLLGSPRPALVVLVLLKIVLDGLAHSREHRRLQAPTGRGTVSTATSSLSG